MRITNELVKLFSMFGLPQIVHSDQGKNFESTVLKQTLEAFGISKSRTTAYHPQGDGLVERFNRSLLQLLHLFVQSEPDWERYSPLVLYTYHTARHTSTGVSPFQLMFGCHPKLPETTGGAFDTHSYQAHLGAKLAELQDLVTFNTATAAHRQQHGYNRFTKLQHFAPGDLVWLSIPNASKLAPHWEGQWKVVEVKNDVNVKISNGNQSKVVHVNRMRHRVQPTSSKAACLDNEGTIDVEHFITHEETPPLLETRRYPERIRHPPD